MKKNMIRFVVLGALTLTVVTAVYAQWASRHPNLYAAQQDLNAAIQSINAAQQANEYDMGGHAQQAKNLIFAAKEQLRLASMAANENR
jgi:hypothetical protein